MAQPETRDRIERLLHLCYENKVRLLTLNHIIYVTKHSKSTRSVFNGEHVILFMVDVFWLQHRLQRPKIMVSICIYCTYTNIHEARTKIIRTGGNPRGWTENNIHGCNRPDWKRAAAITIADSLRI